MNQEIFCGGCGDAESIDRRAFLSKSVLAAVTVALAACASGDATGPSIGTVNGSATIKVADYPELANVNGVASINVGGTPVAVVRTGADSFLALSRICPHQGGTIGTTSSGFMCPVHGAIFSRTGVWQGGERTSNMRQIASTYDAAAGTITLG